MPRDEQVELIDAHPRLGAPPGAVSALSFAEQGYDRRGTRVAERTLGRAAELDRLNAAYEARFGFRYCVFVAGRSRAGAAARDRAPRSTPTATPRSTAPSTPSSTSPPTAMRR